MHNNLISFCLQTAYRDAARLKSFSASSKEPCSNSRQHHPIILRKYAIPLALRFATCCPAAVGTNSSRTLLKIRGPAAAPTTLQTTRSSFTHSLGASQSKRLPGERMLNGWSPTMTSTSSGRACSRMLARISGGIASSLEAGGVCGGVSCAKEQVWTICGSRQTI